MKLSLLFMVIASGCVVCACSTNLKSIRVDKQTSTPIGITYRLPVKQFRIQTTFDVVKCEPHEEDGAFIDALISVAVTEVLIVGKHTQLTMKI
jgi:hypothetical protein